MKTIKSIIALIVVSFFALTSCRNDEFTTPDLPAYSAPFEATTKIYELKHFIYDNNPTGLMKIDTAIIIEGVVTANDKDGNQYKSIIIQDSTAAIKISINAYELHNKYPLGSHLKIKLQGLYIGLYSSLLQIGYDVEGTIGRLDAVLADEYIFRSEEPYTIEIPTVELSQLNPLTDYYKVFRLDSMQVANSDLDEHFADAELRLDGSVMFENKAKTSIEVVTSGYCDYAGTLVPQKSGNMTIIYMGDYKSVKQASLRTIDEITFTDKRFGPFFDEDFTSSLGSFSKFNVSGTEVWHNEFYDGGCAVLGKGGTLMNGDDEDWLISPAINLSEHAAAEFKFRHAVNFWVSGVELKVLISENFTGTGNPNAATWTELTYNTPSAGQSWTFYTAPAIDISAYAGKPSVHIAFKYKRPTSAKTVWEVSYMSVNIPQ